MFWWEAVRNEKLFFKQNTFCTEPTRSQQHALEKPKFRQDGWQHKTNNENDKQLRNVEYEYSRYDNAGYLRGKYKQEEKVKQYTNLKSK